MPEHSDHGSPTAVDPDGPPEPVTAESKRNATRARIVDAAAEVFLEKGYTGTRVVDIARRAGYTSGALYGYFDSRAELLAEAVARSSSEVLGRLLSSGDVPAPSEPWEDVPEPSSEDPLSVLDTALAQLTEPLTAAEQMLLDGVALAHREPVAADRLAAALGRFREELAHGDHGGLSPAAADMVVVLVLGVAAARALGLHDPPPDELRRSLAECLTTHGRVDRA